MLLDKLIKRLRPIATNAVFLSLPGLFNFILSIIVVRVYATEWWGSIVEMRYIYYFAISILAWGNKDYLLREFSLNPGNENALFARSLFTRLPLLALPVIILPFMGFSQIELFHMLAWIILRFLHHAFEPLITFRRKFAVGILSEVLSILSLLSGFLLFRDLSFAGVLCIITAAQVIRTLAVCIPFSKIFNPSLWHFEINILIASLPFAILTITGFLNAKADMFCVISFLSETDTAFYQIFTSFLVVIQTLSNFIFLPFAKNFYRFNSRQYKNTRMLFLGLGVFACLLGLPATFVVLKYGYGLDPDFSVLLAGFFYAYAPFICLPSVYALYKAHQTKWVIGINIGGVAILAALYYACFHFFGTNLTSAMTASALHQLITALSYRLAAFKLVKTDLITE